MPFVLTRDGAVVSAPEITPEQREQLWLAVFRNFLNSNPEVLREDTDEGTEC